ncbi:MAG TPA: ferrochelatase [Oligoflexia bacterium]|nr:ferrochelatase [Oligoflexia bacterium]HMP48134.1 ferrochelatase [Oligoflexia bacterium]
MKNNKSHKYFLGTKNFSHEWKPAVGILLLNLGTPDEPTTRGLRVYLREFLSDKRIIELPTFFWQLLLQTVILLTRPPRVAKLYKSIWTEEGSPLMVHTKALAKKLENGLRLQVGNPLHVRVGMRIGNPSVSVALRELKEKGCNRIIFLPIYGQYSSTTVASGFDALCKELTTWRWVPELRTINNFHDEPGYIKALADRVRSHWRKNGQGDKLLMSFHGVPLRYVLAGDPYHCHCQKTGRLLAEELGLDESRYFISFQSQFGREEWIKPATDKTLIDWAKAGLSSVDVICPGFIVDCLETIEEIGEENKENFLENGGEVYNYIPSLNDSSSFVSFLEELCLRNGSGWFTRLEDWDQTGFEKRAKETDLFFKKLSNCPHSNLGKHFDNK